jgi:hypothetical protein
MQSTRNFNEKIIYYFGALASANAIPMVGQINSRINDFVKFLEYIEVEFNNKRYEIANYNQFKALPA